MEQKKHFMKPTELEMTPEMIAYHLGKSKTEAIIHASYREEDLHPKGQQKNKENYGEDSTKPEWYRIMF